MWNLYTQVKHAQKEISKLPKHTQKGLNDFMAGFIADMGISSKITEENRGKEHQPIGSYW